MNHSPDPRETVAALASYLRLPFASDSVPGAFAEAVIAQQYGAEVLRTYDFVDVISVDDRIGWQVKSTKASTPVTWKRAKIPDASALIEASLSDSDSATQALGDAVIAFCNEHAEESLDSYGLDEIRYARIIATDSQLVFFERTLVTKANPVLFNPLEFSWQWSKPKKTKSKEQLPSLHGFGSDGTKWFAAHLLGENQLHFSGESAWWPTDESDPHFAVFPLNRLRDRISWEQFVSWVTET